MTIMSDGHNQLIYTLVKLSFVSKYFYKVLWFHLFTVYMYTDVAFNVKSLVFSPSTTKSFITVQLIYFIFTVKIKSCTEHLKLDNLIKLKYPPLVVFD